MRVPASTLRPLPPELRRPEPEATQIELAIAKAKAAAGYRGVSSNIKHEPERSPDRAAWLTEPLPPSEIAIAKAKAAVAKHRSVAARIEAAENTHAARAALKDQLTNLMGCKAAEDKAATQDTELSFWRRATERRLNSSHAQCEDCSCADAVLLPATSPLPVSAYALLRPENNVETASRVLSLARERPASGRIHEWRRLNAEQRTWRADGTPGDGAHSRANRTGGGSGTARQFGRKHAHEVERASIAHSASSSAPSSAPRSASHSASAVSLGGIGDAHSRDHADFGCGFIGCKHIDLRTTTQHGLVRHRTLCPFRPVECARCGVSLPHYLLRSHCGSSECPNRAERASDKPLAALAGLSISTRDLPGDIVPRDVAVAAERERAVAELIRPA